MLIITDGWGNKFEEFMETPKRFCNRCGVQLTKLEVFMYDKTTGKPVYVFSSDCGNKQCSAYQFLHPCNHDWGFLGMGASCPKCGENLSAGLC